MEKKPLIGVCPLWDEEKNSYWMLPGYLEGIQAVGGLPIMLPLTWEEADPAKFVALCDGFLFTGGQDVAPALYREPILFDNVHCCEARDAMEQNLLKLAIQADKPILGICRGLQLINALLGGTLYQDLTSQRPSSLCHQQKPPYDIPFHTVALEPSAPLGKLLGLAEIGVNSYHHQAIKTLAPALKPMATAPDGIIEAAYLPEAKFVWLVQWHPEYAYQKDDSHRKILEALVANCL